MNSLTRWNQLRELEDLQHTLGSLFGRTQAQRDRGPGGTDAGGRLDPAGDISEDPKEYLIKVELLK